MKDYELTVLFHPDLEINIEPALDKVKKIVEDNGGKIVKFSDEGKKRLAYSLKGCDFAIYYYYDVQLPAQAPAKISGVLNITDEVIRYLLVTADERRTKVKENEEETKEEVKGE